MLAAQQWNNRNADPRHGRTKEANHAILHEHLLHQSMDQYDAAPEILAADHHLLAEPIKEKLKRSSRSLELWLQHSRPIVKLSRQDGTQAIQRAHKRIAEFFSRKKPKDKKPIEKVSDEDPAPVVVHAYAPSPRAKPLRVIAKALSLSLPKVVVYWWIPVAGIK
jgi:hypothetical protein